jgi:hypothetical protein
VVVGGSYLALIFAPWIPWLTEPAGERPPTSNLIYRTIFFVQPSRMPLIIGEDENGRPRFEIRVTYPVSPTELKPFGANPTEMNQFAAESAAGYERVFGSDNKVATMRSYWTNFRLYVNIVHLLFSLIFGFMGGCACAALYWVWRAARWVSNNGRSTAVSQNGVAHGDA